MFIHKMVNPLVLHLEKAYGTVITKWSGLKYVRPSSSACEGAHHTPTRVSPTRIQKKKKLHEVVQLISNCHDRL